MALSDLNINRLDDRYRKVDSEMYTEEKYTSNRGFYYDSQLEDPFLSISLHPNTYKDLFTGKWKLYSEKESLSPTMGGDNDRYSKYPIARCIMTEDFTYSINNNWTDYNGGNPIENIFDQFKPYAPILGKGSESLKKGIESLAGKNYGSSIVDMATGFGEKVAKIMGNGSNFLNNALMVQGTRFTYYSGSSVNFNNMELKFTVFSDWVEDQSGSSKDTDKKIKFQPVEDYISKLNDYVFGDYHPTGFKTGLENVDNFIKEYVGYQTPPGGFTMDTQQITSKGLNVILPGTMRLNIGGRYAISNLIIKNMSVNLSKVQAKDPRRGYDGRTVPLYAEIYLQLGPACMVVNEGFNTILSHKGIKKDIIEPMEKIYAKILKEREKIKIDVDEELLKPSSPKDNKVTVTLPDKPPILKFG